MTIKNGDLPANPIVEESKSMQHHGVTFTQALTVHSGLTKREYFAAMAMQGMLNGMMCNADSRHLTLISEKSVKAADALLAELEKSK